MTWRWFMADYAEEGVRIFRLNAENGVPIERYDGAGGWVAVPEALEKLLTDPEYPEITEDAAKALMEQSQP